MFAVLKRPPAAPAGAAPQALTAPDAPSRIVGTLSRQAATVGREAAEVRGVLDDTQKIATGQAQALQALAAQLQEIVRAQAGIATEATAGAQAVARASDAVQAVGDEVGGIVDTLRQVSAAAGQITQIALQTRLVAFNATVEAKRAGDAGRGFGVVADAVKDLAAQVERSSKDIMGTVGQLDGRIASLAREIRRDATGTTEARAPASHGSISSSSSSSRAEAARTGSIHTALQQVDSGVGRIHAAAAASRRLCDGIEGSMAAIEAETRRTTESLDTAFRRTDTFLQISEQLIETVAECGVDTPDTPYIRAAQEAAQQIGRLLDDALRDGATTEADLFDESYRPVVGSSPAQHTARFSALADRLFPQVQERLLGFSDKVVFCIAADRNGYIACHNRKYNQPQRVGDVAWNTANCRNRRIFGDRTGLASARNARPFLLQTYRRDMGGGTFVVMKEVAAPIVAAGRHWGGLRLAFKF